MFSVCSIGFILNILALQTFAFTIQEDAAGQTIRHCKSPVLILTNKYRQLDKRTDSEGHQPYTIQKNLEDQINQLVYQILFFYNCDYQDVSMFQEFQTMDMCITSVNLQIPSTSNIKPISVNQNLMKIAHWLRFLKWEIQDIKLIPYSENWRKIKRSCPV